MRALLNKMILGSTQAWFVAFPEQDDPAAKIVQAGGEARLRRDFSSHEREASGDRHRPDGRVQGISRRINGRKNSQLSGCFYDIMCAMSLWSNPSVFLGPDMAAQLDKEPARDSQKWPRPLRTHCFRYRSDPARRSTICGPIRGVHARTRSARSKISPRRSRRWGSSARSSSTRRE